jgi:hypothetical protein
MAAKYKYTLAKFVKPIEELKPLFSPFILTDVAPTGRSPAGRHPRSTRVALASPLHPTRMPASPPLPSLALPLLPLLLLLFTPASYSSRPDAVSRAMNLGADAQPAAKKHRSFVDELPPRFVQTATEVMAQQRAGAGRAAGRAELRRQQQQQQRRAPEKPPKSAPPAPSPEWVALPPSMEFDVLTCSLKECNPMCVCQKILWAQDINFGQGMPTYNPSSPTDQICYKWSDEGQMKPDCEPICLAISQVVDAAAGTDPYVTDEGGLLRRER